MKFLRTLFSEINSFKSDLVLRVFILYLIFSQLYYSYRYILGYNSTATSPTAQDTPVSFQAGKYVFTALLYGVILALLLWGSRKYYPRVIEKIKLQKVPFSILMLTLVYLLLSMLKFELDLTDFSYQQVIKSLFFIPAALVPLLLVVNDKFLKLIFKLVVATLVFQVIGFVFVLAVFLTTGKLPALAFLNDLTRFGGIWDDPNALAMFLLIPLFSILSLSRNLQRRYEGYLLLAVAAVSAMIYMTLSLTAWIALVAGSIALLILKRDKFVLKSAALFAAVFILLNFISPYSKNFTEYKTASLGVRICSTIPVRDPEHCRAWFQERFRSGTLFAEYRDEDGGMPPAVVKVGTPYVSDPQINNALVAIIGRKGSPTFSENFYLSVLFNFGIIGVGLLVALLAFSLRRSWQMARAYTKSTVSGSLGLFGLSFLIAFMVGLTSLPYLAIYPLVFYVWTLIVLILSFSDRSRGRLE